MEQEKISDELNTDRPIPPIDPFESFRNSSAMKQKVTKENRKTSANLKPDSQFSNTLGLDRPISAIDPFESTQDMSTMKKRPAAKAIGTEVNIDTLGSESSNKSQTNNDRGLPENGSLQDSPTPPGAFRVRGPGYSRDESAGSSLVDSFRSIQSNNSRTNILADEESTEEAQIQPKIIIFPKPRSICQISRRMKVLFIILVFAGAISAVIWTSIPKNDDPSEDTLPGQQLQSLTFAPTPIQELSPSIGADTPSSPFRRLRITEMCDLPDLDDDIWNSDLTMDIKVLADNDLYWPQNVTLDCGPYDSYSGSCVIPDTSLMDRCYTLDNAIDIPLETPSMSSLLKVTIYDVDIFSDDFIDIFIERSELHFPNECEQHDLEFNASNGRSARVKVTILPCEEEPNV